MILPITLRGNTNVVGHICGSGNVILRQTSKSWGRNQKSIYKSLDLKGLRILILCVVTLKLFMILLQNLKQPFCKKFVPSYVKHGN